MQLKLNTSLKFLPAGNSTETQYGTKYLTRPSTVAKQATCYEALNQLLYRRD